MEEQMMHNKATLSEMPQVANATWTNGTWLAACDNPFRSSCFEALPFQFEDGWSWGRIMRRLAERNFRGAIVGPKGSGKTVMLEELKQRLAAENISSVVIRLIAGHVYSRLYNTISNSQADVVLLDGAEQLSWLGWLRVRYTTLLKGKGLVVTVHNGRRLPLLYSTRSTEERLLHLLELLGQREAVSEATARRLFAEAKGNIREVFFMLYEMAVRGVADQPISVAKDSFEIDSLQNCSFKGCP